MTNTNGKQPTDPIEAAFALVGCKREYDEGDLVRWGGELFYVEGWIYEAARSTFEQTADIMYSLSRVYGDGTYNDFAECYQDDEGLRLVCREPFADEFVAYSGMDAGFTANTEGGEDVAKAKPEPPKHREREKAEVQRRKDYRAWVDAKLDEYNCAGDAGVLREMAVRAAIYEAGGGVADENTEGATHED